MTPAGADAYESVSSPPPPSIVSFPAPGSMTSSWLLPMIVSSFGEPSTRWKLANVSLPASEPAPAVSVPPPRKTFTPLEVVLVASE